MKLCIAPRRWPNRGAEFDGLMKSRSRSIAGLLIAVLAVGLLYCCVIPGGVTSPVMAMEMSDFSGNSHCDENSDSKTQVCGYVWGLVADQQQIRAVETVKSQVVHSAVAVVNAIQAHGTQAVMGIAAPPHLRHLSPVALFTLMRN